MVSLVFLAGLVALLKIIALVIVFIMLIYGIAVESDTKRKFTEMATSLVVITIIVAMQTVVPKMLKDKSSELKTILTNWDVKKILED